MLKIVLQATDTDNQEIDKETKEKIHNIALNYINDALFQNGVIPEDIYEAMQEVLKQPN